MSDTEKISITLKAGSTFDSPWVVLHADTVQEAAALLDAVALTGIGTKASTVAKGFQAEYAASELGTTHVSATPVAAAPAAVAPLQIQNSAAPTDAAPSCHHGVKVFRQAKPDSGKTWKGYFCPSPQGTPDQCPPSFQN